MLNKFCSFGLLAAAALAVAPAAQAQTQVTDMNAVQSGAAVGPHSSVVQGLNQQNQQNAFDYGYDYGYGGYGYGYDSPAQLSNMNAIQEGAAVGPASNVIQGLNQTSEQNAIDSSYYSPYYMPY